MASKKKYGADTARRVKASDQVVAGLLGSIFGLRSDMSLDQVLDAIGEAETDAPCVASVSGLYPWCADVVGETMTNRTSPLADHLAAYPDDAFLVKDTLRMGRESLFISGTTATIARLGFLNLPFRGFFNSVKVGDSVVGITSLQLISCLRSNLLP